MSQELLPGFMDLLQEWVLKKGPARAPQRMTEADVDDVARASIEALHERVIGDGWGRLEELTQGWLVQRKKGEKPSPLGEDDFRWFVLFVLKGLSTSQSASDNAEAASLDGDEPSDEGVESEVVRDDDPFRFAREHLARAL